MLQRKPIESKKCLPSTSTSNFTAVGLPKNKQDWLCPKCKGSYNADVEMSNGQKWIGPCSDCNSWYNQACVSKKIIDEFGLNDISNDEDSDFVCDTYFGQSEDEDLGTFDLDPEDESD